MPKKSGNVLECGAPHQASQHRLNVTTARLMVPRVSAASSVDPGVPASPAELSSTTVIRVCIHSKVGAVPVSGGASASRRPPFGACVSDQPEDHPNVSTYAVSTYIILGRHCGDHCVFRLDHRRCRAADALSTAWRL